LVFSSAIFCPWIENRFYAEGQSWMSLPWIFSQKLQIPSTKLQMVRLAHHPEQSRRINLKFQYLWTRKKSGIRLYRHSGFRRNDEVWDFLQVHRYSMTKTLKSKMLFGYSNLSHWDLFDIWSLIFGI
jgi:hypothetical protein